MFPNLLIAVLSSMVPGFGLFGDIVELIVSEDPDAGKRFLLDVATSTLPRGVITNLLADVAAELFWGSQVSKVVDQLTPHNDITVRCNSCGKYSNYYIRNGTRITCKNCMSREVGSRVYSGDKIFVLQNEICRLHNDLIKLNSLHNRNLRNFGLDSKTANNDSLDNDFI